MRVLQIVSDLDVSNGITNVLMKYFRKFKSVKYDFLCFNSTPNEIDKNHFKKEILSLGGRVFYIASPQHFFLFRKEWNQFCKEYYGEFDLLENNITFLSYFFKDAPEKLGVKKIITHSHVTKFGDNKISNARNHLFQIVSGNHLGDILFSCSKDAGIKLFGKKCYEKKWYIFEIDKFKFDLNKRNAIRKEMGWNNKIIIGNVGRFTKQKNHNLIIKIFKIFHDKYPNAQLVLIGKGPLKLKIENKIRKLNLDSNVTILANRDDVNDLLQGFDIFLFPSIFEGLGVALVEAQISGLRCLVSSTIPKEANFSNYVQLDLNDNPKVWVKYLEVLSKKDRVINGVELAKKHGYDINIEAPKLEKIYYEIVS